MPHVKSILSDIEAMGVPVIHFGTNTHHLLELQRDAGGTVIGLDHRTPILDGWSRVGDDRAVQGNLDSLLLCAPIPIMKKRATSILEAVGARPGHVFNLGHGIIPETPVDHVKALVDHVHEVSTTIRSRGGA
jgi:uroporphyrinogen decarboxylase